MNDVYLTWNCLAKTVTDKDGSTDLEDCSEGALWKDDEDALNHAKMLVWKDGYERVLVIHLQLWREPKLIRIVGEFDGDEITDWYGFGKVIRSSLKASVDWATDRFEVVRLESEVT